MAIIYDIDFETGDFSELTGDSTGGAQLYVSGVDPITGSFSCNHDWSGVAQAVSNSTSLAGSTVLRLGLRIKIKATFDWGTTQTQVSFFNFLNGTNEYTLGLEKSGANTIGLLNSTTSANLTGTSNLDDGVPHTMEMRIVKESAPAAGDGVNALYIDGLLEAENAAVLNTTEFEAVLIGFFNWQWTRLNASSGSGHAGGIITDDWILRNDDTQIYPPSTPATDEWTAAPMKKPCAISVGGDYIYIAALDSLGQPALIKFSTGLSTDGSVVFQPGAGTDIGVQAGRRDSDVVWIGGDFGGGDVLDRSQDAGASWSQRDPGTFDPISSFTLSPQSDETVLAATNLAASAASGELWITFDDGTSWQQLNSSTGIDVTDIEMLDRNDQEVVIGGIGGDIDYSPNSGQDLEDYSTGFPASDVTKIIVG